MGKCRDIGNKLKPKKRLIVKKEGAFRVKRFFTSKFFKKLFALRKKLE